VPSVTILRKLAEQFARANEWTAKLPNEISDVFFDNPITDAYQQAIAILSVAYFGYEWVDLVESVVWLDELTEARPIKFTRTNGDVHTVSSLDQLCEYLVEFEGWTE
jgi:hypothetical protein